MATGYIDDTMFAVSSLTVEENVEKLERMAPQLLDWSRTYSCWFDLDKFQLIHFCCTEKLYAPPPININGQSIAAPDSTKYLGIVVDWRLKWKEHVKAAIAKGTKAVLAVARLTRPTFGTYAPQVCTPTFLVRCDPLVLRLHGRLWLQKWGGRSRNCQDSRWFHTGTKGFPWSAFKTHCL